MFLEVLATAMNLGNQATNAVQTARYKEGRIHLGYRLWSLVVHHSQIYVDVYLVYSIYCNYNLLIGPTNVTTCLTYTANTHSFAIGDWLGEPGDG